MKILVATTRSQGERVDDVCHTVPGELVIDLGPCRNDTPGECVFGRVFVGLGSGHLTTTAVVVDLPFLDRRAYVKILRQSFVLRGLPTVDLAAIAERSRRSADGLAVGTVVERRRGKTRKRSIPSRLR